MRGRLFIISAPSGAGKSSMVTAVIPIIREKFPIEQATTYTTKPPRYAGQDNRDHHYNIDNAEFERRIQDDFFLEWSDVYGAYYGTPRSVLDDLHIGKSYILVIDRIGAQQVLKQVPDTVLVWITVSKVALLRERLLTMGTETPEQIERRLKRAQVEIDLEVQNPLYHYHILNENFEQAVNELAVIITENGPK